MIELIPPPRSKDGAPLTPSPRHRLLVTANPVQLVLNDVSSSDAGVYAATARSPAGASATRAIELRVGDRGDGGPPAFLRRLADTAAKVGTRTRFLVEIGSGTRLQVSRRTKKLGKLILQVLGK